MNTVETMMIEWGLGPTETAARHAAEGIHVTAESLRYTLDHMKRRKPKSERKEATIVIRLTREQKETLTQAAKKTGLGLSGWVLSLALKQALSAEVR
jgi:predicted HicB family RNase H-like nuclease